MVVRRRRQRKGLQGDTEVTPGAETFPRIFWQCVSGRKGEQPKRRTQ